MKLRQGARAVDATVSSEREGELVVLVPRDAALRPGEATLEEGDRVEVVFIQDLRIHAGGMSVVLARR